MSKYTEQLADEPQGRRDWDLQGTGSSSGIRAQIRRGSSRKLLEIKWSGGGRGMGAGPQPSS